MVVRNATIVLDGETHPFGQIGVIADVSLAVLLLLCTLLGTPANLLWVMYFIKNGRRDIATMLYQMVGVLSIVLLLNMVLVSVSLLNHREPCLFKIQVVCTSWTIIHRYQS